MAYNVYWIGRDGNVYTRQGDQVSNQGKLYRNYEGQGFDAARMSAADVPQNDVVWREIDDPAGAVLGDNVTASSKTTSKPLNDAAVRATGQAIDALGTQESVGRKNIEDSYGSLIGGYDREAQRNEADYGENTVTNTTNLQKNKQNALVSAAQGRRGLRGVLASIGALFGTGGKLADRAVTTEANEDIGGAVDTAATNSQQLDKAIGRFREEDENRRTEAGTARKNQETRLEGDIAADRQRLYKSMADIYKESGDEAGAATWLAKAGDLNEFIAGRTAVASTPFSKLAAVYTPGQLADYLAGAGDMTVDVGPASGAGITQPSLLAGPRRKRRDTLVPAAA